MSPIDIGVWMAVIVGLGGSVGTFIVGLLNDSFAAQFGDEAIRYSLLTISATGVLGSLFFYLSSRTLAEDLERTRD